MAGKLSGRNGGKELPGKLSGNDGGEKIAGTLNCLRAGRQLGGRRKKKGLFGLTKAKEYTSAWFRPKYMQLWPGENRRALFGLSMAEVYLFGPGQALFGPTMTEDHSSA